MVQSRLRGAASFRRLLRRLPATVREEMADVLAETAPELLRQVKADAPFRTGALRAGLAAKVLRASLRLRVGLITAATARRLFYGRILEFGRKGQVVTARKARGAPYKMRVRAMGSHPFVFKKRPELRGALNRRLNTFWTRALTDAAEGADLG